MAKKRVRKNPDYPWIVPDLRPLAVPIGDLKPDPQNARTHDEANVKAIAASLREYGQVKPLVVNRRNGQIVAGNGTLAAARSLGWSHLAVVWVQHDKSKQHGLSIADNRTAELAEWDDDVLAVLLGQVEEDTPDLYADLLLADLAAGIDEAKGERQERVAPEILAAAGLKPLAPNKEELAELKGRKVLVEFSGGKDSSAAAIWCRHYLPKAEIELCFVDLGADFIGFSLFLHHFADWLGCKLTVLQSTENMIDRFLEKGEWPHFKFPYCQELLHQALDKYNMTHEEDKVVVVRGGRRQEAGTQLRKRRSRKQEEIDPESRWLKVKRMLGYKYFQPLYFSDKASSETVLAEAKAPVWEGYGRGMKRTACRICPGQRPRAYAAMRKEFPDVWAELLALEAILGPGCWQGRQGKTIPTFEQQADKGDGQLLQDAAKKESP